MLNVTLSCLKPIATLASGFKKSNKLFILIYHRVLDEPDFMRPGEVDRKAFEWQMSLLKKYFNVLPLHQALSKMDNNTLPARAVCITFDDGYADNYLNALPILKQHDLTATFFIANGYMNGGIMWNDMVIEALRKMTSTALNLTELELGSYPLLNENDKVVAANLIIHKIKHLDPDIRLQIAEFIAAKVDEEIPDDLMLTDEQLIALQQNGMEIGGHTVTHPILAKLDEATVASELKENKSKLEQLLNVPLRFFAYPNGKPGSDYTEVQTGLVKTHGYQAAVSTQWGVADKISDRYQLPRFTPWDNNPVRFMLRMIWMYFGRE